MFDLNENNTTNDVLAWLGRFNEHAWEKRVGNYEKSETNIITQVELVERYGTTSIKYSNSVTHLGKTPSLVNPQTISINYNNYNQLAGIAPCYISNLPRNPERVYYLPNGTNSGSNNNYTIFGDYETQRVYLSQLAPTKAKRVTYEGFDSISFVFSKNRSQYPDDGYVDEIHYVYIGIPFDKLFKKLPQIKTDSYEGTGTYGLSNPNTLTFDFAPKVLLVSNGEKYFSNANNQFVVFPFMLTTEYVNLNLHGSTYANYFKKSTDGKTLYWYSTDSTYQASAQYNAPYETYSYLAIG